MPTPSRAVPAAEPRARYHHDNLREALIEAAVELIAQDGVHQLSVREVAKRAGVSPGAPFRHFANRTALLTAVAEQATQRLRASVEAAVQAAASAPPMARFGAIGHAYLGWARDNPTHFRVISERALIDYAGSAAMLGDNEAIRRQMGALFVEAFGTGADFDAEHAQIAARALVYGLARMAVDGHFPEWSLSGEPTSKAMDGTLDFFIGLLAGARRSSGPASKTKARAGTPKTRGAAGS